MVGILNIVIFISIGATLPVAPIRFTVRSLKHKASFLTPFMNPLVSVVVSSHGKFSYIIIKKHYASV